MGGGSWWMNGVDDDEMTDAEGVFIYCAFVLLLCYGSAGGV